MNVPDAPARNARGREPAKASHHLTWRCPHGITHRVEALHYPTVNRWDRPYVRVTIYPACSHCQPVTLRRYTDAP